MYVGRELHLVHVDIVQSSYSKRTAILMKHAPKNSEKTAQLQCNHPIHGSARAKITQ